jgi:hypothetical protein
MMVGNSPLIDIKDDYSSVSGVYEDSFIVSQPTPRRMLR